MGMRQASAAGSGSDSSAIRSQTHGEEALDHGVDLVGDLDRLKQLCPQLVTAKTMLAGHFNTIAVSNHDGPVQPELGALPGDVICKSRHGVFFEACSAFTRVAACTLARSPYFVTRYPKASDISSPPCLLRLLPVGAVAGWGSHPLESAALSRRAPRSGHSCRTPATGAIAPLADLWPARPAGRRGGSVTPSAA